MLSSKDISVIIQGPVLSTRYKNEDITWTQKCILQLRMLLPDAQLILSTWDHASADISPMTDIVIRNPAIDAVYYDEHLGIYDNTNRQIITTRNGLQHASRPYALKIRTDTVLSDIRFLAFFDKYKKRNAHYSVFNSRIVASSLYAKKYAGSGEHTTTQLFQPSDIILFGLTSDLLKLYDIPLNTEQDSRYFKRINKPCYDAYPHMLCRYTPEQHIFISCLRKAKKEILWPHRLCITEKLKAESEKYICDNYVFLDQSVFSFEIKDHTPQRYLDASVRDGLYRQSVWLNDYNRLYNENESLPLSAEEKYSSSQSVRIRKAVRVWKRYSFAAARLLTRIKYIRPVVKKIRAGQRYTLFSAGRQERQIPAPGKYSPHALANRTTVSNIQHTGEFVTAFDIISFDIFDTLLKRHVDPVTIPAEQTGLFAEYLLRAEGITMNAGVFNALRRQAILETCESNRKCGLDAEYNIYQIIALTLGKAGVEEEQIPRLTDIIVKNELSREIETLYFGAGVEVLLNNLCATGKTLIAVSDMYFPSDDIKHILACKGLLQYLDAVYVSSDYMLTKHTGRLYDVLKDEYEGKSILHVGDNIQSDVISARRRGISGLWLNDGKDLIRKMRIRNASTHTTALKKLIETHLNNSSTFSDAFSDAIFKNISYDFVAFSHHILQYAHKNNIERLYFLERDGSIFCDIIQALSAQLTLFQGLRLPELHRLKMPRRVSAPLGDISCAESVINRACKVGTPETLSVSYILAAYGIPEATIHTLTSRHGEEPADISDFIDNYTSVYQPVLLRRRGEVLKSLSQSRLFDKGKIAVVDVGWGGTTQKDIGTCILRQNADTECHGIYYGADERTEELMSTYPRAHQFFGYHDASAFFGSYSLLEFLIKHYATDGSDRSVSAETLRLNIRSREVIISSVSSYAELVNRYCLTADDISRVTAEKMRNFVNHPPLSFVNKLAGASFSLDRKEDDDFIPLIQGVRVNTGIMKSIRQLDKNTQWVWGSLVYSRLSFICRLMKK
ncbi:WavE lipopolysaccharide synthesis family protein [Enterobacter cloacae]|uniref:WavE lipopolysaccharide synthesis family protein n=1 Tax=Enterobacter cloacae TaxID=550 RepID=UPI00345CA460